MNSALTLIETDASSWDEFANSSPQATIYSLSQFLATCGDSVRYFLLTEGNEIVAGTPAVLCPSGMKEIQYNGILFKDFSNLKAYKRIEKGFQIQEAFAEILFNQFDQVIISNHWENQDIRPFEWFNYSQKEKGHYRIDVRYTSFLDIIPENLQAGCKEVRLNSKKTSCKFNLRTEASEDYETLDRLHRLTFHRQGLQRRPDEGPWIRSLCKALLSTKQGRLYFTYQDNTATSASFFGIYRNRAYYIFGASDPEFRKTETGTRNLFDAFEDLYHQFNIREVDLLGVNSPQRGGYKLSFGGSLQPYYLISKVK